MFGERKFAMLRSKKFKLAVAATVAVLISLFAIDASSQENNLLDVLIAGIVHNEGLITSISFDYTVDCNVSDEWRARRLEFTKRYMCKNWPEGREVRVPNLEPTLRTGSAVFEGNKFKISSKCLFLSDGEVFNDEIVACDGIKLMELNLKENTAYISNDIDRRRAGLFFDPRNFPVLFVDGQPLHLALTAKNTATNLVGTEEIDGTMCYVIEMVRSFTTPEGVQKQSSRRCWIGPDKGYRVKKAISYGTNSFDGKALTVTRCKLTEAAEGIWYYSKVTFESYPLSLPEPDVIEVLELKNIVVNQKLKEKAFTITFSANCLVEDQIAGRRYRVGEE